MTPASLSVYQEVKNKTPPLSSKSTIFFRIFYFFQKSEIESGLEFLFFSRICQILGQFGVEKITVFSGFPLHNGIKTSKFFARCARSLIFFKNRDPNLGRCFYFFQNRIESLGGGFLRRGVLFLSTWYYYFYLIGYHEDKMYHFGCLNHSKTKGKR